MSRLTDSIPKGSVFWIKWELEDLQGNKFNPPQYHYYKAEATGKKRNNMFQVRYDDGTEQYYSTRGVNTRTKNILTEDAYNDGNIITIGEKQPRVGDEFQAVVDASPNGPGIPMSKFAQNALNLVPLTNKEIEQQDASTELPDEVQKDMDKAGMSKKGYSGGKRRKKKTRNRKSRKKQKGGERTPGDWIKYNEIGPTDICIICNNSLMHPRSPEKTAYFMNCGCVAHTKCLRDWCDDNKNNLTCQGVIGEDEEGEIQCGLGIDESCINVDEYLKAVSGEEHAFPPDDLPDILTNPSEYWRLAKDVGNAPFPGGARRRRRKTRRKSKKRRRKSRRKKRKTKKRKMRKNKKTRKRKQKGRGANICKMISDPDKKNELKVMALSRAKRARRDIPLHPETKQPLTSLLSMLEAHNYCQEMNNDNYRCDGGSGMCEEMDSEAVKNVINGMLSGRGFK